MVSWMEDEYEFSASGGRFIDCDKDEQGIYKSLFSIENQRKFYSLYSRIQDEMVGISYSECEKIIDMLAFMQEVLATAIWKHNIKVEMEMENFARDFDRLDVVAERIRLYESVQKKSV